MKISNYIVRATALLLLFPGTLRAKEPSNVLMIAVDDLRPMLGCYGDRKVVSPNIDRLASQGRVYTRAYCQYAKCGTSRLSLMTGLRPDSVGVFSNNTRDVNRFRKNNPGIVPLGQWFKQHGYETRSFGKIYHDGWDNPANWSYPASPGRDREMWEVVDPNDPGAPTRIAERLACPVMQSPDVEDDHLFAGRMTNEVLSVLKQDRDKPVFLAVGFRRPHLPFVAPKRYYDLYQPDDSWLPENPNPPGETFPLSWFNSDGYIGSAKRVGLTMPAPPNREQAIEWNGYEMRSYLDVPYHGPIPEQRQIELIHAYAACISYIDAQIGRILDALEESGMQENTIIAFWSDHGWHLGEHSAWGKMTNYELATRVPLLLAGPGIDAGTTDCFAELVDLYPTLTDLAGLPGPGHLEGESLIAEPGQTTALSQYERYKGKYKGYTIREKGYRYMAWFDQDGNVVGREYYNHKTDPAETTNIAEDIDTIESIHARLETLFDLQLPKQGNDGQ